MRGSWIWILAVIAAVLLIRWSGRWSWPGSSGSGTG